MIKLPKLAFVSRSECDVLIYDSVGKNLMKTFLPEDVVTQSIFLREAYPIVCSFRFLWKLLKIVVGIFISCKMFNTSKNNIIISTTKIN